MEKKKWFWTAIVLVAVSVVSLFVSVMMFTTVEGTRYTFTILDIIASSNEFDDYVIHNYYGPVIWDISETMAAVLAVIAAVAIVLAVVGLITLRAQRPNTWQMILTIAGLAGTAVPSLVLIICVLIYGKYFDGNIGLGIAPLITPAAMAACIAVVVRRKNKLAEMLRKEMMAQGKIWKAGDL